MRDVRAQDLSENLSEGGTHVTNLPHLNLGWLGYSTFILIITYLLSKGCFDVVSLSMCHRVSDMVR